MFSSELKTKKQLLISTINIGISAIFSKTVMGERGDFNRLPVNFNQILQIYPCKISTGRFCFLVSPAESLFKSFSEI
jgi:hypothetical protein